MVGGRDGFGTAHSGRHLAVVRGILRLPFITHVVDVSVHCCTGGLDVLHLPCVHTYR